MKRATAGDRPPFIQATGQLWKVVLGVVSLVLFGGSLVALAVLPVLQFVVEDVPELLLVLSGGAVAAMAWLCASVRCPRCGTRTIWTEAKSRPLEEFLRAERFGSPTCPTCGYDPSAV